MQPINPTFLLPLPPSLPPPPSLLSTLAHPTSLPHSLFPSLYSLQHTLLLPSFLPSLAHPTSLPPSFPPYAHCSTPSLPPSLPPSLARIHSWCPVIQPRWLALDTYLRLVSTRRLLAQLCTQWNEGGEGGPRRAWQSPGIGWGERGGREGRRTDLNRRWRIA